MPKIRRTQFTDEFTNFIGNLSHLMKEKGLSMQDVAEITGVNKFTVSNWLYNRSNLRTKDWKMLMEKYNLTPFDLFDENQHSTVNLYDFETLNSTYNTDAYLKEGVLRRVHIDPRLVDPTSAFAVHYARRDLQLFDNPDDEYIFVVQPNSPARFYSEDSWDLVLMEDRKSGELSFRWHYIKKLDGYFSRRVFNRKNTNVLSIDDPANSASEYKYQTNYRRVGVVRQIIVLLDSEPAPDVKEIPAFVSHRKCLSLNISTLMKKFGYSQYTEFAHSLGISEPVLRRYLFKGVWPTQTVFNKIYELYGKTDDELLEDKNRDFVDVYGVNVFAKQYLNENVLKASRYASLPIDKDLVDSYYCFAIKNNNRDILEFNTSVVGFESFYIIDSRYSTMDFEIDKTTLNMFIDCIDKIGIVKWVTKLEDGNYLIGNKRDMSDAMEISKFAMRRNYEHVGRVIQVHNYNRRIVETHTGRKE